MSGVLAAWEKVHAHLQEETVVDYRRDHGEQTDCRLIDGYVYGLEELEAAMAGLSEVVESMRHHADACDWGWALADWIEKLDGRARKGERGV